MKHKLNVGDRVYPSEEYEAQIGANRTRGTVVRIRDADMYVVRWDGDITETLHGDFLSSRPAEFVVVDASGWRFPHAGRTREEAIARHVSILWSMCLDEFPEIPPTLVRGRLSPTQQRAWAKSEALGHSVRQVEVKIDRRGRPPSLDKERLAECAKRISDGEKVKTIAADFGVTPAAIYSHFRRGNLMRQAKAKRMPAAEARKYWKDHMLTNAEALAKMCGWTERAAYRHPELGKRGLK